MKDSVEKITVCNKCLRASCWHGFFMCDNAILAGTIQKSKEELIALNLEHPSYWDDGIKSIIDQI